MKNYYRVMMGKGSIYAEECIAGNYIGVKAYDAESSNEDLTNRLPDDFRAFNREFIPRFLAIHPEKSKIGAGLAGSYVWTLSKGIKIGDTVLSPDGTGIYRIGEVMGDYYYAAGQILAHRRSVNWLKQSIERSSMSYALQNSAGSVATVCDISGYRDEIEMLIGAASSPTFLINGDTIEDPYAFALEKHLEDFLVQNWAQTDLGRDYNIYTEDGETVGQQYQSDTGIIDILATSKNKRELLVVELKRGRATDVVVGQVLRYMGYVMEELAEAGQVVKGVIIALEDDPKLRRALVASPNISFYRYQISFKLVKA